MRFKGQSAANRSVTRTGRKILDPVLDEVPTHESIKRIVNVSSFDINFMGLQGWKLRHLEYDGNGHPVATFERVYQPQLPGY